ncbi:MAG: hypothetical protein ACRYHA_16365 [Janthinobacterium lividum]
MTQDTAARDLPRVKQQSNTDPTQVPEKTNDEPATVPENDHVASPLDEPAPTSGVPFDQTKEANTRAGKSGG